MTDDPFDSDEWRQFAERCITELVPKIDGSSVTISLVPNGPSDVKFAVELGFSIMMDKPIIAVIQPGMKVPGKLLAVADSIVEFDPNNTEGLMPRLGPILEEIFEKQKQQEGGDS